MTILNEQKEKIISLLKNDAKRRAYIREYMKGYRQRKLTEIGISQKQYNQKTNKSILAHNYYYKNSALTAIKYLFQ